MSTIIIIKNHYKEFPLVIAANRNEEYNKQFTDVQILEQSPHLIIGCRDEEKGETWLGVNKHSLFATFTNQGEKNPELLSRGKIVLDLLKSSSIEEMLSFVEDIDPSKFNGFNLIFGNQNNIYMAQSYILHSMVIKELSNGIHVINNDMTFSGEKNKTKFIHKKLDNIYDCSWLEYYKYLKKILSNSDYGIKIKPRKISTDSIPIGIYTVSSSILAFSKDGLARFKYHNRKEERPVRKTGDPFIPRYKDYIDLWRDSDNSGAGSITNVSEENDFDEEDLSPKEKIVQIIEGKKFYSYKLPSASDLPF